MQTLTALLLGIGLALAGCAAANVPAANLIDEKPVVKMGSAPPEGNDYILLVPAGQEFPIQLRVSGSLINAEGEAATRVSFKRDVYLYQHWASYDGRDWHKLGNLFGLAVSAGMQPDGALVTLQLVEQP